MSWNRKESPGFTLIELLIVVAIIGILAALLIPNALMAIQKAKMRGTQDSIASISTALGVYMVDKGRAPNWDGSPYSHTSSIYTDLSPYHLKGFPLTDEWGNGFNIHSGTSWNSAWLGMIPADGANDEFAVGSPGRNDSFIFDYSSTGALYYRINSADDFLNDLVNWNGNWVCAPRALGPES